MTELLTEKDYIASIKASQAINALDDVLTALVHVAGLYIERGLTQEGADVLAYIRRREGVPEDISDHADELWEELETWICPRVLYDAEDFGKKAYLDDVIEYVYAGVDA